MYNAVVAGMAFVQITMKDAELRKGLAKSQKKIESFADTAKRTLTELNLASTTAFTSFLGVTTPLYGAISAFTKFDDKIRTLKAISGGSSSAIASLEKYIRKQGATTAFTADQVAEATVELSRMGFEVDELREAIRPVMDLVRSTGEETFRIGEVADYAASVLRIFNLRAGKFGDVCDVMAFAANKSSAGIADMGEAFKIAGPSAAAVQEDVRDVAAALMLMANAGIKGSLAGTSLRKIYQSLSVQSGKVDGLSPEEIVEGQRGTEELQALGIQVVDPKTGNLRKAADIMLDLAHASRQMKTGEKINFATEVFDLRGSLGALTMLADSGGQMQKFKAEMQNISGYASKLAKDIEDGPGGKLRKLFSGWNDMVKSFGLVAFDTFGPFIELLTRAANALSQMLGEISPVISALTKTSFFLLGFGAAIKSLATVGSAIKSMFAPMLKVTGYFDLYATGAKKAALAALEETAIMKRNAEIKKAEQEKDLARQKLHQQISIANTKKAALEEAKVVEHAEKQKLIAARERFAEQEALNKRHRIHHTIAKETGVSGLEVKSAQKGLAAQEAAVEKSAKKMHDIRKKYYSAKHEVSAVRMVELAEQKKLDAVRKRFSEQEALNEKWRLQHTLSGSNKKFQNLPEFDSAKKDLAAQEKVVSQAIKAREALEKKRHLAELQHAAIESRTVLSAEQQKLAAARARYAEVKAIQDKQKAAGLTGKFRNLPEFDSAKKDLAAQERAVKRAAAAVKKYSDEFDAADAKVRDSETSLKSAELAFNGISSSVFADGKMRGFHTQAVKKSLNAIGANTAGLRGNGAALFKVMTTSQRYLTVLNATSVAQLKAAGISRIFALALKGVASAKLALNKLFRVILDNPFSAVIISVTLLSGLLTNVFDSIQKIHELKLKDIDKSVEVTMHIKNVSDIKTKENLSSFDRLKQLSELSAIQKLSVSEIEEAVGLINRLEPFGSKSWSKLDEVNGRLSLVSRSFDVFYKNVSSRKTAVLRETLKKLEGEMKKIQKEYSDYTGVKGAFRSNGRDKRNENLNVMHEKMRVLNQQIDQVRQQLIEVSHGKESGLTGVTTTGGLAGRIENTAKRIKAAAEEIKKAKDRIVEIDDANDEFFSSDLENEIHKIRKLRAEYEKYIQILLAAEKAKSTPDAGAIKDLESRLAQARADFSAREKEAQEKAKFSQREYTHYFVDKYNQREMEQKEKAVSDYFSSLMSDKNFSGAQKYMVSLINKMQTQFNSIVKQYNIAYKKATSADSERGSQISFGEEKALKDLQEAGSRAFDLLSSYRDRLAQARKAGEDAMKQTESPAVGDWSARALQQMLGGGTIQERTAKASEETARNTRRLWRGSKDGSINFA